MMLNIFLRAMAGEEALDGSGRERRILSDDAPDQ